MLGIEPRIKSALDTTSSTSPNQINPTFKSQLHTIEDLENANIGLIG